MNSFFSIQLFYTLKIRYPLSIRQTKHCQTKLYTLVLNTSFLSNICPDFVNINYFHIFFSLFHRKVKFTQNWKPLGYVRAGGLNRDISFNQALDQKLKLFKTFLVWANFTLSETIQKM